MRSEQEMAERNNIIARAAELIRDSSAGTPQERATRAAELLRSLQYAADDPNRIGQGNCGIAAPHAAAAPGLAAQHTFTGSVGFLVERDQWKERALAAESKLDEASKLEFDLRAGLDSAESERESLSKIVDAYEKAMVELREAIGIDGYAEHEHVIDTIRRIRGRENTLDVRVQELERMYVNLETD